MFYKVLTNVYFIAIGIPIILLILGAVARKLVRGDRFRLQDFYLGVELLLVSLASAFLYFFELMKVISSGAQASSSAFINNLLLTGFFVFIIFCMLLVVLAIHQSWEERNEEPWLQFLMLGIFSNLIGSGLLFSFVIIVRGS